MEMAERTVPLLDLAPDGRPEVLVLAHDLLLHFVRVAFALVHEAAVLGPAPQGEESPPVPAVGGGRGVSG